MLVHYLTYHVSKAIPRQNIFQQLLCHNLGGLIFGGKGLSPSREGAHEHQQLFVAILSRLNLCKVNFPIGPVSLTSRTCPWMLWLISDISQLASFTESHSIINGFMQVSECHF